MMRCVSFLEWTSAPLFMMPWKRKMWCSRINWLGLWGGSACGGENGCWVLKFWALIGNLRISAALNGTEQDSG